MGFDMRCDDGQADSHREAREMTSRPNNKNSPCRRRWFWLVVVPLILAIGVCLGLVFTTHAEEIHTCSTCGAERGRDAYYLFRTCIWGRWKKPYETIQSKLYADSGCQPCQHKWQKRFSRFSGWLGQGEGPITDTTIGIKKGSEEYARLVEHLRELPSDKERTAFLWRVRKQGMGILSRMENSLDRWRKIGDAKKLIAVGTRIDDVRQLLGSPDKTRGRGDIWEYAFDDDEFTATAVIHFSKGKAIKIESQKRIADSYWFHCD